MGEKQFKFLVLLFSCSLFVSCDSLAKRGETISAVCAPVKGNSPEDKIYIRYTHLAPYPNTTLDKGYAGILERSEETEYAMGLLQTGGKGQPQLYVKYSEGNNTCAYLVDLETGAAGKECGENPIFDARHRNEVSFFNCTLFKSDH